MAFDFSKEIILENERALIRPLKATDLAHLLPAALSDPNLLQYSPLPVNNEQLLQKYIGDALISRLVQLRYPFIIFDKEQNKFAGSTSFGNISNKDLRIEIGWTWYGKEFQRTGLNRHCKFLLMQYIFEELQFERVELKTDERNLQSRKAIEALGAKFEGILRSHMVVQDGFRRNTVYYSILRSEWMELKHKLVKRVPNFV